MFRLTITALTFLFLAATAAKAEADLSKVHVITSFYEPYSYLEDSVAQGIAVNQAREIFAELDFYPVIHVYPWARAYNLALTKPNSIIFSVARTPEREDKFYWIGEIVDFNVHLYRDKNKPNIQVPNLDALQNYRVGALNQDVKGQYLIKKGVEVTTINSEVTGIKLTLSGRIDLLPIDLNSLKFRLKKLGLAEDAMVPAYHLQEISRPLYIAMNKETPIEIVEAFKAAYKRAFP
jgi:polar amino acid transport system substrate-binding protein